MFTVKPSSSLPPPPAVLTPVNPSLKTDATLPTPHSSSLAIPLSMVSFENVNVDSSPTWVGADFWKNIPLFSIVSGPNGSGKTHLLSHIRAELKRQGQAVTCLCKFSTPVLNQKESRYQDTFIDAPIKPDRSYYPIEYPNLVTKEEKAFVIETIRKVFQQKLAKVPVDPSIAEKLLFIASGFYETYHHYALESIQDDVIWKYYTRPYINQLPKDENAFIVLHHIFENYISRCQNLKHVYRDITFYSELTSIYESREYVHEKKQSSIPFAAYVKNKENLDFLLNYAVRKNIGKSPWEEINALFKDNGLDLQIVYEQNRTTTSNLKKLNNLFFTRNTGPIEAEQLSSGEKLILEMLSWQFYIAGLSNSEEKKVEVKKVDMLLLDEPDRHFDPQLIKLFMACLRYMSEKHGVQVIMTTHRTDTLTLAPEGSIFTIKRDHNNRASIIPTHRLNALFKLTPNSRLFTHFHLKVYTESLNDAWFYGWVYAYVLNLSRIQRKGMKKTAENKAKTLSERVQLDFYSLALDKKGGSGGCAIIPITVQRDIIALENLRQYGGITPNLYDSKITYPLGLIDADTDLNAAQMVSYSTRIKEVHPATQAQLFFTSRSSLENYLYDPVFLFSLLNRVEIEAWFAKDAQCMQHALACQQALTMPLDAENELIQSALDGYFRYFLEKFVASRVMSGKHSEVKKSSRVNYHQLYGYLQFDHMVSSSSNTQTISPTKAKIDQKGSKKSTGIEMINILETLAVDLGLVLNDYPSEEEQKIAIIDRLMQAQSKAIDILSVGGKKSHRIQYPGFFIYTHGHTLEDFVQKVFSNNANLEGCRFKEWMMNKIATIPAPLNLPMDLVNVIFKLNARARAQLNAIIKPNSQGLTS